ncbi:MAG: glutamate synthase [Thermoanaerobaculia bacterium]
MPYPIGLLVARLFAELDREDAIYSLPRRKFFTGRAGLDFSVTPHGLRASSPLGPAAGPHTQMAQNIVLGWLGGCRIFELKTVQVLDDLAIPRPCIDMRTIGYNAEWSQELTVDESLAEYVKASMLIEILAASGRVPIEPGFRDTVYDMSVGYDLAGIQSEKVGRFFDGMSDAHELVDAFRRELPAPYRDLEFATRISRSVTLSTFHGCPPDEIERIALYLMRERGLDCVVKFNPTLLGSEDLHELLHERLGYTHIHVPDGAFERDTTWPHALAMVERLSAAAAEGGVGFGVKFTNTLVVENETHFLPESQREVYLSGAPLHVLAMQLVARFHRHFGDRVPVSFSAGIDAVNYAHAVALGLAPVTVCTDLLRPGGYGRLASYHSKLAEAMEIAGATTIDDYAIRSFGNAVAALEAVEQDQSTPQFMACRAAIDSGTSLRDAAGPEMYARWVSGARILNTERYAELVAADPRYAFARNARGPARVDRHLALFDCISCDKCIPVCPNDANFAYITGPARVPRLTLRGTPEAPLLEREPDQVLEATHQLATFADFCNRCGNCDVFCPEEGGPYAIKPLFFGSDAHWRESPDRDGFFVTPQSVLARIDGRHFRLDASARAARFSGEGFEVELDLDDPESSVRGRWDGPVPLTWCFIMDLLRRSVLDTSHVNYVNMRWRKPLQKMGTNVSS